MVHGQWYDLASFAERHPGGAFWLTQTVGMDVTELYETHHLGTEKADAILKARLVGPAAPGYSSFYDYEPAGLYCTLKRRVAAALVCPVVGVWPVDERDSNARLSAAHSEKTAG